MLIKKRSVAFITAVFGIFIIFSIYVSAMTMEEEFEGYLITAHSGAQNDEPETITKECITMPECAASGYGISVSQPEGGYRFYKFDENGQKLAEDILKKTVKECGIAIIAKGTLDQDILKVASLTEKVRQTPAALSLDGWLIEKSCSGSNNPAVHTKGCCLMTDCAASGYGITVKQQDGSYKFYRFDQNGHNLAAAYLKQTAKKDNLTISVKGVWDGDILKVTSFTEKY